MAVYSCMRLVRFNQCKQLWFPRAPHSRGKALAKYGAVSKTKHTKQLTKGAFIMKHPFERPGIGKSAATIAPARPESLTIRSKNPIAMRVQLSLLMATLTIGLSLATPALADNFFFSTGNTDAKLGALSRRPSAGKIETETADDFLLTETTVIRQATIVGLVPPGTPLSNISNVEVEVYHVFPGDSANPPSGNVPTRVNSPADVEIDEATRDGFVGNLRFTARL